MKLRINGVDTDVHSVAFPMGINGTIISSENEPRTLREPLPRDYELAGQLSGVWPLTGLHPSFALHLAMFVYDTYVLRERKGHVSFPLDSLRRAEG